MVALNNDYKVHKNIANQSTSTSLIGGHSVQKGVRRI